MLTSMKLVLSRGLALAFLLCGFNFGNLRAQPVQEQEPEAVLVPRVPSITIKTRKRALAVKKTKKRSSVAKPVADKKPEPKAPAPAPVQSAEPLSPVPLTPFVPANP